MRANLTTILVSGVSPSLEQAALLRLFEEYGSVIGVDLAEGQDFGFIRMETEEQARRAIDALNGKLGSGVSLSFAVASKRTA